MIRLLPDMPMPIPERPTVEAGTGHADFGQWLSDTPEHGATGAGGRTDVAHHGIGPVTPLPEPALAPLVPAETTPPPLSWRLSPALEASLPVPTPVTALPAPVDAPVRLEAPSPRSVETAPVAPQQGEPTRATRYDVPPPSPAVPVPVDALASPPSSPVTSEGGQAPRWQLQTPAAGSRVVVFTVPWELRAGAHLSQSLRVTLEVEILPMSNGSGAQGRGQIAAAPTATISSPGIRPLAPPPAGPVSSPWLPGRDRAPAPTQEIDGPRGMAGAASASPSPWPMRLLRWLNADGQGPVAWMRDFTADPAALPTLVDTLRRFAQAENIPLRRIVLNGQTLWSADAPNHHRPAKA